MARVRARGVLGGAIGWVPAGRLAGEFSWALGACVLGVIVGGVFGSCLWRFAGGVVLVLDWGARGVGCGVGRITRLGLFLVVIGWCVVNCWASFMASGGAGRFCAL